MTDEMLELPRHPAPRRGAERQFLKAYDRGIPLPDESVNVIISNCIINLSPDKPGSSVRSLATAPGGRFAVTDVIADSDMDDATRADMPQWIGCIAGR